MSRCACLVGRGRLPRTERDDAAPGSDAIGRPASTRREASRAEERKMLDFEDGYRLNRVIPGETHTYSQSDDQYPENAPQLFERGSGAYLYTPEGEEFLDYGIAIFLSGRPRCTSRDPQGP